MYPLLPRHLLLLNQAGRVEKQVFKGKNISNGKARSLSQMAWKRFKRNKLAMSGLIVISVSVFIFIAGYLITPDSTPDSNDQKPELQIKPPGFSVRMLKIRKNEGFYVVALTFYRNVIESWSWCHSRASAFQ